MQKLAFLAAVLTGMIGFPPPDAVAQEGSAYVSMASRVVGTHSPAKGEATAAGRAKAATGFLASLTEEQRARAMHPLTSPERRMWTNLPASRQAGGIRLGDLDEAQVRAACDLLAAVLSEQGYRKMCRIMIADDQLLRGGRPQPGFGTENFAIVVFGQPSATEPWALQLDGHHVGVNVALRADDLTLSPSFIGTQPEAFRLGESADEVRPLAAETEGGFRLLESLSDEQRKLAIVGTRRGQLSSGPGMDGRTIPVEGLACSSLTEAQREHLMALVANWVRDLPKDAADKRMKALRAEIDRMHFAWRGPAAAKSDVSFAIQGPSLIIEYACQDLGGNPLAHLHTMYRDPTNEYGGQHEVR